MSEVAIHRTRAADRLGPPVDDRPLGGRLGLEVPRESWPTAPDLKRLEASSGSSIDPIETRQGYRERLAQIERRALEGLDMVGQALEQAMDALMLRDVARAADVVAGDDRIDARYLSTHQALLSLLALQAPVASDLRLVTALLHASRCFERMGDQCVTIAKMVPLTASAVRTDELLLQRIARMGELVRAEVGVAKRAFAARASRLASELAERDGEVNALNRETFRRAVEVAGDPDLREWAMRMTLVARCLERVGDNAVDIAEQAAFVVTGRFDEPART